MGGTPQHILLIGASGTIGSAINTALTDRGHTVVSAGRSSGDFSVDLGNPQSIELLYQAVGPVQAVVCAAGLAAFGALPDLTDADWELGIRNKMMGQVNLVRTGLRHLAPGGSFTLTTGTLSTAPTPGTAAVAMVGGAVESFTRAAAIDLEGRFRVNVVSPGWVAESRVAAGLEPRPGIWARELAEYYADAVEGDRSGAITEATGPRS